jgi:hypothetical protein
VTPATDQDLDKWFDEILDELFGEGEPTTPDHDPLSAWGEETRKEFEAVAERVADVFRDSRTTSDSAAFDHAIYQKLEPLFSRLVEVTVMRNDFGEAAAEAMVKAQRIMRERRDVN